MSDGEVFSQKLHESSRFRGPGAEKDGQQSSNFKPGASKENGFLFEQHLCYEGSGPGPVSG